MTQSKEHSLKKGIHIGVYEIKEVIRTDDFGITYRAWNEHLNSLVAMTEYFPADLAIRDEGDATVKPKDETSLEAYQYGLQQFIQQAEILEEIKHQNLVGVHNVLQFNDTAYLVMDLEEGDFLSIRQDLPQSFNEEELTSWLRSLLSALQSLHTNGAVHGDIHPSNILIRNNGVPALTNYSAARMALATHNKRLDKELRGGYAAPELFAPDHLPDTSTDLYALGATLFRCISQIDPPPSLERQKAIENQQPDPLQLKMDASASEFNEPLLKCIVWMLALNPSDRPKSALEVSNLLDENREEISGKTDSELKTKQKESAAGQSHHGLTTAIVIGIIFLLAGGLWYFQRDKRPEAVDINQQHNAAKKGENLEEVFEPEPEVTAQVAQLNKPLISDQKPTSPTPHAEADEAKPFPSTPVEEAVSPEIEPKGATPSPEESNTKQQPGNLASPVTKDNRDELIEQHLAIAEEHIKAFRLSTPQDNNAYQQYQAVLEMDPKNKDANAGVQKIVDLYAWFIKVEIQKENYKTAHTYLVRAMKILPDDPELQKLRQVLLTKEY